MQTAASSPMTAAQNIVTNNAPDSREAVFRLRIILFRLSLRHSFETLARGRILLFHQPLLAERMLLRAITSPRRGERYTSAGDEY